MELPALTTTRSNPPSLLMLGSLISLHSTDSTSCNLSFLDCAKKDTQSCRLKARLAPDPHHPTLVESDVKVDRTILILVDLWGSCLLVAVEEERVVMDVSHRTAATTGILCASRDQAPEAIVQIRMILVVLISYHWEEWAARSLDLSVARSVEQEQEVACIWAAIIRCSETDSETMVVSVAESLRAGYGEVTVSCHLVPFHPERDLTQLDLE